MTPTPPVALTIAGSDSGGGAGIQADLATFVAFGVHGTSVVTAVTAQNTRGVTGVHELPVPFVSQQMDAVCGDFDVVAVKTGMIGDAGVLDLLARQRLPRLVVDPVMVATTGSPLYQGDSAGFLHSLGAAATVLTPNIPEAQQLLGGAITSVARMHAAAAELAARGPQAVVLKGGHLDGDTALDVVAYQGSTYELSTPRVATGNTHGTGCTLSAAITAALAHGRDVPQAITEAKDYITAALRASADWRLGRGAGPPRHLKG